MRRDPRVTLLCYDPRQPLRYLEIRGTVVEMTEDGALEHLDALASKYAGRPVRYFGDCIPAEFAETRDPGPVPDPTDPRRRARRDRRRGDPMTTIVATETVADPGLAPRPPDPADLRRADDDAPRRPAAVEPGLGRPRRRVRPGQHDARSAGRGATCSPTRRSACSSSTPTTPAGSSRSAATPSWSRTARSSTSTRSRATYTRHPRYYGFVYPAEQQARETRVICRIHARRITLDAIHA